MNSSLLLGSGLGDLSSLWLTPRRFHHLSTPPSPLLPRIPSSFSLLSLVLTLSLFFFFFFFDISFASSFTMKLTININPFRSKKSRSVSRSDPQSLSSGSSGSSSSDGSSGNLKQGLATPTSVLHPAPGYWSDFSSSDLHYDLFQAFKLVDKDGDGKITTDELQTILSRVVADNPNERDIMLMLADIDAEGEGSVSLEKLGEISSAFGPACGSELRDAFDIFDADRNGKISAEELLQVFSAIGDDRCTLEDCRRMIAGVDSDGDGFVCFEDFSRMMMEQQRH